MAHPKNYFTHVSSFPKSYLTLYFQFLVAFWSFPLQEMDACLTSLWHSLEDPVQSPDSGGIFTLKGQPGFPCLSPLCSKTPNSSCVCLAAPAAHAQEEMDYG